MSDEDSASNTARRGRSKRNTRKTQSKAKEGGCVFCNLNEDDEFKYGKLLCKSGIMAHNFCMLFSSALNQRGKTDNQGILGFLLTDIQGEVRRGRKLRCCYCKKYGATVGCAVNKCGRKYHLPCGLQRDTLQQFFGSFSSFCPNHRPIQKISFSAKKTSGSTPSNVCSICLLDVDTKSSFSVLFSPCCKNSFHRNCIQQQAISAGYFFKCPLCNNKDSFERELLTHGIYIPEKDASWELEENAFEDLLLRYERCDIIDCKCPEGRTYNRDGSRWEIILCNICGSQGCHIRCGRLAFYKQVWECDTCKNVVTSLDVNRKKRKKMNKNDSAPTASSPSCSAETKWRTPRTLTSDDQIVERIRKYQMELKNMVQQSQSEDGSNVATASTSQLKPPSSSTITTTTTTKPFLEENPVGDHKSVTNETEDVIEVVCISDESDTEIDVVSVNEKNGQDGVDIQRDASSLCNSEADNNDYVEIVDDLDLRLSPTDFPSPCLSPSNELIGGDVNDNQDIVEMKSDSLAVKTCAETAIGTCDSAVGGKAEHPVHSQDLSRRMSPYSSSKSFTPIYTNDDLSSAAPARKRLKCDANVVNDASDDESLHSVVGCSSPMSLENPHTIFYVPTIHYGDEFTIAREPSCIKNLQGTVNTIVTSLIFDNRTVDHQSSDEAVNAEEYSLTNVETSPDIEFIKYKMNKKKKKKKKKKKSKRKEKRERLNDAEKLKSRHSSKKHKRRRRRHFENENLDDSDRYVFQQSYLNRPFVGGGTDTPTESRNSNS